jgi:uncharacterized protein (TIGR02266 family)
MGEKRRAYRIRVNLRARYRSSRASIEGWVSDLSRHGLFLRCEYLDESGGEVSLDLDLPGRNNPLSLAGEVVRVDTTPMSSGMAIRFGSLGDETRRALANFMIERSYQSLH